MEAAAARRAEGWTASVCSRAAKNCWARFSTTSPKRPVWDTGIKELIFVGVPHFNQTQPEMALLDHKRGHRTTQGTRGDLRRSEREVSGGSKFFQNFWIVTTLVQVLQCLSLVHLQ